MQHGRAEFIISLYFTMQQAMQTLRNRAFGKRTSKPDSSPENTKDPYLDTRRKRTAIIYDWLKSQNVTWPTTITGFVVCTLLIWLNIPSKPFSLPTDQRLTLEPTASHNTSYDQFAVLLSDTRRPAYSAYRQGNSAYKASLQGVNKVLIVSDTPFPSVEGQSVMQRTHAHLYNFMQGARDILNSFPETKWFVYMDPGSFH